MFVWVRGFTSQSTVMVMLRRLVHLTTLFSWASLTKKLTSTSCTYFRLSFNVCVGTANSVHPDQAAPIGAA